LMLLGAVGMTLGEGIDLWNLATVLEPAKVARWLPWVAFGAGLVVVSRRFGQGLAVPLSIVLAVLAFYVILLAGGGDIESAQAAGLLLGPFDASAEGRGLGPWIRGEADWLAVLRHLPTIAVVAGMALVGCLLNASALEVAAGRRID